MLSHLTWAQYWTVIIILSSIYYLFIAILFYSKEISGLFRTKANHHHSSVDAVSEGRKDKGQGTGFDGLELVVADIKSIMTKAGTGAQKELLLGELKAHLAGYEGIRHPAFRKAINHYIMRNAEHTCGVGFEEEELEAAWDSLPR